MSETAVNNLEKINRCLANLPEDALNLAAARMEGFADGFSAAQEMEKHPA